MMLPDLINILHYVIAIVYQIITSKLIATVTDLNAIKAQIFFSIIFFNLLFSVKNNNCMEDLIPQFN